MKAKELYKKYEIKAMKRGSLYLLNKHDALNFIKEAQLNKLRLLGIDSFKILGKAVQPYQDCCTDIGDEKNIKNLDFFTKTKELMKANWNKNFYFEVTIEDI